MEFTIAQIAQLLGGTIEGEVQDKIHNIASIEEAKKGEITFFSNPKYEQHLYSCRASAIILQSQFVPKKSISATLIKVQDPYLAFSTLLKEYQRLITPYKEGIDPNTSIAKSTQLSENIYIGAFSVIGENCKIGKNVKIHPQVFIGDNVEIGENTQIHPGVKIYSHSKIGKYCTLFSGVVIGSDGFGYVYDESSQLYQNVAQIGNVILEDYVEIGANSTIDCATLKSTIIKRGVKIDNLVQIAHNVEIGENTVIASQTGISGSTKIGKKVIIAGQVGIVGHIEIADNTILGAKSGVSNSVVEKGTKVWGNPAQELKKNLKSQAIVRKLPELVERVKVLEKKLVNCDSEKK